MHAEVNDYLSKSTSCLRSISGMRRNQTEPLLTQCSTTHEYSNSTCRTPEEQQTFLEHENEQNKLIFKELLSLSSRAMTSPILSPPVDHAIDQSNKDDGSLSSKNQESPVTGLSSASSSSISCFMSSMPEINCNGQQSGQEMNSTVSCPAVLKILESKHIMIFSVDRKFENKFAKQG